MAIGGMDVADPLKKVEASRKPDVSALVPINSDLLKDVGVSLEARLGRSEITVADLTALKAGSVLTLDRSLADHVDLYLNGALIARGEIVAVGEAYGVRIVDIGVTK